jgi:hypothetical protein
MPFGFGRKKTIDDQAQEPVRRTEAGKYGDNSEMSPHNEGTHKVDDEQKAAFSYAAPASMRNKKIDKMIEEDGG